MRSTAPFAVSAAPSRVCGRWLRAPVCRARRFGYSNDASGRRTAISRSGEAFGDLSGAVDAYGYNERSEVVSARRTKGGASVRGFDEDFSYDPIGNRVATTNYDETGSAIVSEYAANSLNQYTSRTVPGVAAVRGFADVDATVTLNENQTWRLGEYFYGSDDFDNSAAPVDAALVTTAALASPTNGPDEVASVTSRVHIAKTPQLFEYDLDGNQTLVTTKTGTWRVTYNGENRPVRWTRINAADTNGQTMISMNFDHQGRRRLYLEVAGDGSTNRLDRFTYDNYLCVARNRWSPDGTSAADHFTWDPTEPVATRPLAFYQPNAPPQLYAVDGNKNVAELVSSDDGTISAHYEYASFGEVIISSGGLAFTNPFRFSSEYADDTLSLIYYNYRHLDPATGRWTNRDPADEMPSCAWAQYRYRLERNGYLLVNNQPSRAVDMLGLTFLWDTKPFPGSSTVDLLPGVTYYFCFIHDNQDGTVWLRRQTAKDLDKQMRKVAKRLCQYERKDGRRTLRHEIAFDTNFFEGEYQQHQYYHIEGHDGVWADNEVNYIGIGMYEAWLGHSIDRAAAITVLWKLRYLDRPSNGTIYWLAYGHVLFETYYSKLDLCTCKFKDGNDVDVVDNERRGSGE